MTAHRPHEQPAPNHRFLKHLLRIRQLRNHQFQKHRFQKHRLGATGSGTTITPGRTRS